MEDLPGFFRIHVLKLAKPVDFVFLNLLSKLQIMFERPHKQILTNRIEKEKRRFIQLS